MSDSEFKSKQRKTGIVASFSSLVAGLVSGAYSLVRASLSVVGAVVGGVGNFIRNSSGFVIASAATGFANFFGVLWGGGSSAVGKGLELGEKAFAIGNEILNVIQKGLAALAGGFSAYIFTPLWNKAITPGIVIVRTILSGITAFSFELIRNTIGFFISGLTSLVGTAVAIISGFATGATHGLLSLSIGLTLEVLNIARKGIGLVIAIVNVIRNVLQNTVVSWVLGPLLAATFTILKHIFKTSAYFLLEALQFVRMGLSVVVASLALILNRLGQLLISIGSALRVFSGYLAGTLVLLGIFLSRGLGFVLGLLSSLAHFLWNNIATRLFAASLVIANLFRQLIGAFIASLIYGLNLFFTPIAFLLKGVLHSIVNLIVFSLDFAFALSRKLIGILVAIIAELLNSLVKLLGGMFAITMLGLTLIQNYILSPIAALTHGILHGLKHLMSYLVAAIIDGIKLTRIAFAAAISLAGVILYRGLNHIVGGVAEVLIFACKLLLQVGNVIVSIVYFLFGGWEGAKALFLDGLKRFDFISNFGQWFNKITDQPAFSEQLKTTFKALAGQWPFESQCVQTHQTVLADINFIKSMQNTYQYFSSQDSAWSVAKTVYQSIAGHYELGSLFTPTHQQVGGDLSSILTAWNHLQIIEPLRNSFSSIADKIHQPELFHSIYHFFGGSTDIKQVYNKTFINTCIPVSSTQAGQQVYNLFNPSNESASNVLNFVAGPKTLAQFWQEFKAQFSGDALTKSFNHVFKPLANPENFGQSIQQISWSRFTSELILNCQDAKDACTDAKSPGETFTSTLETVSGNNDIGTILPKVFETIGDGETPWSLAKKTYDFVANIVNKASTSIAVTIAGEEDFGTQISNTYNFLNHPGVFEFYNQLKVNHPYSEVYRNIFAMLNGNTEVGSYWNKLLQRASAKALFLQSFRQIGGEESIKLFHKINNSSFFGKKAYLEQQVVEPLFYQLLDDKNPIDFCIDSYHHTLKYTDRLFSGAFGKIQGLGMLIASLFLYTSCGVSYGFKNSGIFGAGVGLLKSLFKIFTLPFRNIMRNLELLENPNQENNGAWDMMSRDMEELKKSQFVPWSVFGNNYEQGYVVFGNGKAESSSSTANILKQTGSNSVPSSSLATGNTRAYVKLFDSEPETQHVVDPQQSAAKLFFA